MAFLTFLDQLFPQMFFSCSKNCNTIQNGLNSHLPHSTHILNTMLNMAVNLLVSLSMVTVLIHLCLEVEAHKNMPTMDNLLMVFILCRHGDRSPVHTFPTDPYRKLWKMGYGQLTAYGAEQHHELGRLIRKRYSGFIPEVYHKDEVLFRSSGTERTLMSANNFIRGFYDLEIKGANNFPPVFSRQTQEDHLLKMSSKCPKFKKIFHHVMNSSMVSQKAKALRNFFVLLEHMTGYTFPKDKSSPDNFYPAWCICDPITIWVDHSLPSLPHWITSDVYKQCADILDYKHYIRFSEPRLTRLRGGPLAAHMLDLFREGINNEVKNIGHDKRSSQQLHRRFVAYFAHDSTLAAIMSHLEIYNGRKPPLASCLVVELHRSLPSSNDHRLLFYYLNETKLPLRADKLVNLWPTKCGVQNRIDGNQLNYACSFHKLESSLRGTYATNVAVECYENDVINNAQTTKTKLSRVQIIESYCYHPQLLTLIFFQTAVVCYFIVRFLPIPVAYLINNFRYSRHVQ
uniref:acid phosphatase n=1 Tax=Schistosoma japonicum TaxID=6182 RepID=C1LE81_SCHJA|nr:acid phosphatase, prostate [Schistosoma japonicum]